MVPSLKGVSSEPLSENHLSTALLGVWALDFPISTVSVQTFGVSVLGSECTQDTGPSSLLGPFQLLGCPSTKASLLQAPVYSSEKQKDEISS